MRIGGASNHSLAARLAATAWTAWHGRLSDMLSLYE